MTIKDLLNPLLKWWWLLVLATVVAGVAAYYATQPLPPIYQSRTTLIVGGAISELNPDGNQVRISISLADTYATLAHREPIMDATREALGLSRLPEYTARALPNNQMIEIRVVDTNPQRAQAVANELAHQIILASPTSTERQNQDRLEFINRQLDDLQAEILSTREQLNVKQDDLLGLSSAVQIADAQAEINGLQQKLTLLQTNYSNLLMNTQRGAINTISVIEPASLPTSPVGPNKAGIILMVSAIGFVLAGSAAHLLEYLDKTIKSPEDVSRVMGLPVIGFIGEMERKRNEWDYVAESPRSPIAEAFRSLRTNIEFAGVDEPIRTILITSADASDGKTTVATNLGIIMAQGDKKVVVMDADLRRPQIHKSLNIPIQPGLTEVFRDKVSVFDAVRNWKDRRVTILPSGTPPPNPAELLGSKKMDQIMSSLEEVVDVVVIDGPPFVVTDSSILAAKVDAVLLVIRPGQTREEIGRAVMEQMQRAGANVIGVVLNRIPRRGSEYYYSGYPVYSPYFDDNSKGGPKSGSPGGKSKEKGLASGSGKLHTVPTRSVEGKQ
jgi:polysaccharide biosynthesis transport protein